MRALITLAFHTGLRLSNLLELDWQAVDLQAGTVTVQRTKNGRPHVAVLTEQAQQELKNLPGRQGLIFPNRYGRPYNPRRLWARVCKEAGLPGRNFHQLRHACGSALAAAGVGQAQIMAVMGHRTLTASARYMHFSVDDKQRVVTQVFGAGAPPG
jgi:integrase